jgi:hypothetical protein
MIFLRIIKSRIAISKVLAVLMAVVIVTASTITGYYMINKPSPSPDVLPSDTVTPGPSPTYVLTVSSNPSSGGSVSVSPSPGASGYVTGSVVTLTATATANSNFTFSHFMVDGVSVSSNSVTMNSAHKVVAYFTKPFILSSNSSEWTSGYNRYFGIDVKVKNEGASGNITITAEIKWPDTITLSETKLLASSAIDTFKLRTSAYLYQNTTAPIITKSPYFTPPQLSKSPYLTVPVLPKG